MLVEAEDNAVTSLGADRLAKEVPATMVGLAIPAGLAVATWTEESRLTAGVAAFRGVETICVGSAEGIIGAPLAAVREEAGTTILAGVPDPGNENRQFLIFKNFNNN